jgi:hypothetical protein
MPLCMWVSKSKIFSTDFSRKYPNFQSTNVCTTRQIPQTWILTIPKLLGSGHLFCCVQLTSSKVKDLGTRQLINKKQPMADRRLNKRIVIVIVPLSTFIVIAEVGATRRRPLHPT